MLRLIESSMIYALLGQQLATVVNNLNEEPDMNLPEIDKDVRENDIDVPEAETIDSIFNIASGFNSNSENKTHKSFPTGSWRPMLDNAM